ncbi:C-X-C motif chemokine 10-like [Boleophthalmus pectinirostris]|uniref:C-X-C motif chemokine 10-like n=1 Tax=Boleophthalmus pectinirostris TaxID=150288 RepID=UPI000A1C3272|nr:C-X-C motif chemokine 10-like [Boleophthalmus pectinirostris]
MINSSIKVLLALAALALICDAQQSHAVQQCLCANVRNTVDAKKNISDIQIYPPSDFCNRVEIVVTSKSSDRYCLNPDLRVAKMLLNRIIRANK